MRVRVPSIPPFESPQKCGLFRIPKPEREIRLKKHTNYQLPAPTHKFRNFLFTAEAESLGAHEVSFADQAKRGAGN